MRITKTRIIGATSDVYAVWEPSSIMGNHHEITSFNAQWYGRIGTRNISAEVDTLPPGSERFAAVRQHYQNQYEEAYAAILSKYPELANVPHTKIHGEIVTP